METKRLLDKMIAINKGGNKIHEEILPKISSLLFLFLFLLLRFARLHSASRVSGSRKENQ